jgi:biotin-(acetyl-CoA carboxylase) ligase/SAM-dependent methyltransferase
LKDQKNIIPNAGSKEVLFSIGGSSDYELLVPKTVYPPREDSTLLINCINNLKSPNGKALEIGCGTGIISIALARNDWSVEALDINPYAVISTKENIRRIGLEKAISVREGGVGEDNFSIPKGVTLIVWNLPYLTPPSENEERLEWIEEASMSDLADKSWGQRLAEFLELEKDNLDPELLVILLQRKYPESPSKTIHWTDFGWSHRVLDSRWLFDEKLEVLAYWKPGLGDPVKKLKQCESTMDEAKKLPQKGWQRVITEKQTGGRGRRGSSWISKYQDLLATWSIRKTILEAIDPGLLQVLIGSKIANILDQYCKWPNDIVNSRGEKIGGILIEMDSVNDNLRIGLGINQFDDYVEELKIGGWKQKSMGLKLDELFRIIDTELSSFLEHHPLLRYQSEESKNIAEAWRNLSKLLSRGYSLKKNQKSHRVLKLESNGELLTTTGHQQLNIRDIDSLEWLF